MTLAEVDLLWIPLGAGGWFVANNGRVYERVTAWRGRRPPLALYHTALKVRVPEGSYVIENAWPIPDEHGEARGVVAEAPVFSRRLGRLRTMRYDVRRWQDGVIDDEAWALPRTAPLTADGAVARRVLDLAPSVPTNVWGRDEARVGDMWNSNSVIAWLLARAGARMGRARPPEGGRAPGWRAGLEVAARADDARPLTPGEGAPRRGSPSASPPRTRPTSSPGRGAPGASRAR